MTTALVPTQEFYLNSITAIDPTGGSGAPDAGEDTTVQDAFQQGILHFILTMLQGAENDVVGAINDTSSDPDAVG